MYDYDDSQVSTKPTVSAAPVDPGPWNVFVSYSRQDQQKVVELTDLLEQNDLKIWVDFEGIAPSTEWMEEIENGIANADAFLLCVSPDSVASNTVLEEVALASRFGKRIVTVLLRETHYNSLPPPAARIQWIDAQKRFDVATIVNALSKDLEWLERHTYL